MERGEEEEESIDATFWAEATVATDQAVMEAARRNRGPANEVKKEYDPEGDLADVRAQRGAPFPLYKRTYDFPYKHIGPERARELQERLRQRIPTSLIEKRKGTGATFVYISGQTARGLADAIFGMENWSFIIVSHNTVDVGGVHHTTVHGRLIVFDIVRENIGTAGNRVLSRGNNEKAAETDCFKRCLMMYGWAVGGMLYDMNELARVKRELGIRQ